MRLIKPSFEILEQKPRLEEAFKLIELAGRTCYKSTDKITENSSTEFVERMLKLKHTAMLEHGTIYLYIPGGVVSSTNPFIHNPYCKVKYIGSDLAITTNYRVIVEGDTSDKWLQYFCEPTEYHEKRVSVKFVTDRGVSHELVRHRKFSFAQESSRYCNYSADKFGNSITYIIPSWVDIPEGDYTYWDGDWCDVNKMKINIKADHSPVDYFLGSLDESELIYKLLLNKGWKPQQARQVLPNALKTEIIMTGFISDWQHFFDLRALGTTGAPHPDMKALAEPLMNEFKSRGLLE